MEYKTHKDNLPFVGGSLAGYVDTTYRKLVQLFGKPMAGDGYKTDAEWEVQFEDGLRCDIYNYKDGKNYNGAKGTAKTKITDWHIGSHHDEPERSAVVQRIRDMCRE